MRILQFFVPACALVRVDVVSTGGLAADQELAVEPPSAAARAAATAVAQLGHSASATDYELRTLPAVTEPGMEKSYQWQLESIRTYGADPCGNTTRPLCMRPSTTEDLTPITVLSTKALHDEYDTLEVYQATEAEQAEKAPLFRIRRTSSGDYGRWSFRILPAKGEHNAREVLYTLNQDLWGGVWHVYRGRKREGQELYRAAAAGWSDHVARVADGTTEPTAFTVARIVGGRVAGEAATIAQRFDAEAVLGDAGDGGRLGKEAAQRVAEAALAGRGTTIGLSVKSGEDPAVLMSLATVVDHVSRAGDRAKVAQERAEQERERVRRAPPAWHAGPPGRVPY